MKRLSLILIPLTLAACDGSTVRDTVGLTRKPPDEFRVVSRPPLSVPPEFNLRPPAGPGEPAMAVEQDARAQASSLVKGGDDGIALRPGTASTAVLPVTGSELESAADSRFLERAGALRADDSIREKLTGDATAQSPEEQTVLQKLRAPNYKEPLVNAKGEAERLEEAREKGAAPNAGETPMSKPKDTGTLGRIFGY